MTCTVARAWSCFLSKMNLMSDSKRLQFAVRPWSPFWSSLFCHGRRQNSLSAPFTKYEADSHLEGGAVLADSSLTIQRSSLEIPHDNSESHMRNSEYLEFDESFRFGSRPAAVVVPGCRTFSQFKAHLWKSHWNLSPKMWIQTYSNIVSASILAVLCMFHACFMYVAWNILVHILFNILVNMLHLPTIRSSSAMAAPWPYQVAPADQIFLQFLQLQIVGFRLQQLLKLLLEALAAPWKWPWHDIKSIQKKTYKKNYEIHHMRYTMIHNDTQWYV